MEDEQVMTEDGLQDVIGAKYLKMNEIFCFFGKLNFSSGSSSKGARKTRGDRS